MLCRNSGWSVNSILLFLFTTFCFAGPTSSAFAVAKPVGGGSGLYGHSAKQHEIKTINSLIADIDGLQRNLDELVREDIRLQEKRLREFELAKHRKVEAEAKPIAKTEKKEHSLAKPVVHSEQGLLHEKKPGVSIPVPSRENKPWISGIPAIHQSGVPGHPGDKIIQIGVHQQTGEATCGYYALKNVILLMKALNSTDESGFHANIRGLTQDNIPAGLQKGGDLDDIEIRSRLFDAKASNGILSDWPDANISIVDDVNCNVIVFSEEFCRSVINVVEKRNFVSGFVIGNMAQATGSGGHWVSMVAYRDGVDTTYFVMDSCNSNITKSSTILEVINRLHQPLLAKIYGDESILSDDGKTRGNTFGEVISDGLARRIFQYFQIEKKLNQCGQLTDCKVFEDALTLMRSELVPEKLRQLGMGLRRMSDFAGHNNDQVGVLNSYIEFLNKVETWLKYNVGLSEDNILNIRRGFTIGQYDRGVDIRNMTEEAHNVGHIKGMLKDSKMFGGKYKK